MQLLNYPRLLVYRRCLNLIEPLKPCSRITLNPPDAVKVGASGT